MVHGAIGFVVIVVAAAVMGGHGDDPTLRTQSVAQAGVGPDTAAALLDDQSSAPPAEPEPLPVSASWSGGWAPTAQDPTATVWANPPGWGPAAPMVAVQPVSPAITYQNCDALHRDYPHGVGRVGAQDQTSDGTAPVTDFTQNDAVYAANATSDTDGDGIACEQD